MRFLRHLPNLVSLCLIATICYLAFPLDNTHYVALCVAVGAYGISEWHTGKYGE
jgi:hypothetical protein